MITAVARMQFQPRIRERRGLALLLVMMLVLILGFLLESAVRTAFTRNRLNRIAQNRVQAEQLARAGWDLARSRLEINPEYKGEIWEPDDPWNKGLKLGWIEVKITTDPNTKNSGFVHIIAKTPNLNLEPATVELDIPFSSDSRLLGEKP